MRPTALTSAASSLCLLILALLASISCVVQGQTTVLRASGLIDVQTGRVSHGAVIVVDSGRITAINPNKLPPEAHVVELGNLTLVPGYIDVEAHLASVGFPDESPVDLALDAASAARAVLRAGFTTIRSGGQQEPGPAIDVAIMHAIEDGRIEGPRVIPSGHLVGINGGHCDLATRTAAAPGLLRLGTDDGKATGAVEFAKAVRSQMQYGARTITLCATGGVGDQTLTVSQHMTSDELRSAIEVAHLLGAVVFVKAHTSDAITAAVSAGGDVVVHASILTDSAARLLTAKHIFLVPTLNAPDATTQRQTSQTGPSGDKLRLVLPAVDASFRRAMRAGISIAYGSDRVGGGKENLREFASLMKHGMSSVGALQSATVNAAAALRLTDRGEIKPGLLADIIGLEGDPSVDGGALAKVRFVMKGGIVYVHP
jgi:imidazolonepropionase-like amidohydrolase